jgi:hypothetical protein
VITIAAALVAAIFASFAFSTGAVAACGNPVACENALPGDSPSDWQVTGVGDSTIQGFATSMSVNVGGTISFKIKTPASSYHIDILRLGYYGGLGARKIASNLLPSASLPQSQPACQTNSSTGLIDCGNWGVSASWTVPSTAVSGVYIAHLVRNDTGGSSQIPFVVRDDSSHSDMLLSTSDATWQAYNDYGGNSLYDCTVACPPGNPGGYKAAYAVSYNRPFDGSLANDNGQSYLYYAEYQMVRFLEKNGYDVSYTSSSDVDRAGSLLLNHKVFMSSAHDEYWSAGQRASVEAARDHGVNLAFFSGNEMFWKTRWASDASGAQYRTLITYKETHFDAVTDPNDPPTWTGTWRDPRFSGPGGADGDKPENGATGEFFIVNGGTTDIQVSSQYAKLRLWRNTAVANLASGQTLTLGAGIGTLGYEWDEDADNGSRPNGLIDESATTSSTAQSFIDYGTNVADNQTATHHLTLYRAPSGALVFGAGTVQWSWGLDNTNAWNEGSTDPSGKAPDPNMQQATVNLLADMGAQPITLSSGLGAATPSSDTTPPSSTITAPSAGANLQDGDKTTITGSATDSGGGVVAGVEVSTDSGKTWHPATLTTPDGTTVNWSYTWVANGSPTTTIESRATDDSGNTETPSAGTQVNVSCPCTIFGTTLTNPTDSGDTNSVELGMKFTSSTFGTVTGIRFYKEAANTGTHVGSLWSSSGQLLAQAMFSGETASGWQQVNFSSPVPINPNTTYVVSYHAPVGRYAQGEGYFYPHPSAEPDHNDNADSPPLHAVRSTEPAINGLYDYSTTPTFPANTYAAENYWVDPVFSPAPAPGPATNPTAVAGNSAAAVSWAAPSSGGPVTSYIVTPYIGTTPQPSTTVTGSPAPTSTTINGLTNGTTYTFTVTASNPNGNAAPSGASNAVTPSGTLSAAFNSGFENGLSFWSSGGIVVPTTSTAKPHSGSSSALLGTLTGTEPAGDSWVSQTVTVPATATLTFWYWSASTDGICSGSACQYDWDEAQIRSTSGATLATVFKSNTNAQAWTQVSYDMSAYAGQTVVLWFNVHQDAGGDPTYMYLDDISLTGSGATAPGAPTNVSATAGNGQATVNWTAPSSNGGSAITSYTVTPYIGSTAQTPTTVTGSPPATNATVTGLTNGTAYTFTVTATNSIGTGLASNPSTAVTPAAVPGAPTNVSATAGNAQATVSWTAPSSDGGSQIMSYTITAFVGTTQQSTTTITGAPPATSATITGLTNGTTYTFTVTATNAIGNSPASSPSNAVTPMTAPGAPTNVSATAGNGQATVNWTPPSSNGGSAITSYTVTPYIGSTAQTPTTVTGSPPATTATVTGLTNGTAYTFTVKATNTVGTGAESAASTAVTPGTVTPAFVQQVSARGTRVTTRTVIPASNITAGNTLVVLVGVWSSGKATAKSVSDTAGNSYTKVQNFTASDGTELSVWTAPITAGGGTKPTITVTPTAKADVGVAAVEYSGLSSAIDQSHTNTSTTGASAGSVSSGPTAATTASNELAVGFYIDSGFNDTLTAGSGFTSRVNVSKTTNMELLVEDRLPALGETPNASAGTGANTVWLMSTIVFKHS